MTRIPDATGQKFEKVTILQDKLPKQKCLIKCDCGVEKTVRRYDVLNGKIKSCGSTKCAGKWIDITGQRFDQLVATQFIGLSGNLQTIVWECQCDCGSVIRTGYSALVTGHKKSCGCIKSERISRSMSLPIKITVENEILHSYKQGAKKRNLDFKLTKSEFINLLYNDCFYCGSKPSNFIKKNRITGEEIHYFNGVDRVNNEIGYRLDNCVTCCKLCNHAKNNLSKREFIILAKKISKRFPNDS
jgi:hypothetical protein